MFKTFGVVKISKEREITVRDLSLTVGIEEDKLVALSNKHDLTFVQLETALALQDETGGKLYKIADLIKQHDSHETVIEIYQARDNLGGVSLKQISELALIFSYTSPEEMVNTLTEAQNEFGAVFSHTTVRDLIQVAKDRNVLWLDELLDFAQNEGFFEEMEVYDEESRP